MGSEGRKPDEGPSSGLQRGPPREGRGEEVAESLTKSRVVPLPPTHIRPSGGRPSAVSSGRRPSGGGRGRRKGDENDLLPPTEKLTQEEPGEGDPSETTGAENINPPIPGVQKTNAGDRGRINPIVVKSTEDIEMGIRPAADLTPVEDFQGSVSASQYSEGVRVTNTRGGDQPGWWGEEVLEGGGDPTR